MPKLDSLCDAVKAAAATSDDALIDAAVADLCDWLHANPERAADVDIGVVKAVRAGRHFQALKKMTDSLNGLGHPDPRVRLYLAQGLIDTGSASTAIDILRRIKPEETDERTQIETSGLTGRAFKDLFLRVREKRGKRRKTLMNLAVQHYGESFDKSGEADFWSGENLLALLRRAKAEGIEVHGGRQADAIAAKVASAIEETPKAERNYWQWASLAVIHINAGAWSDAQAAFCGALDSKGVDAFSLGGTIRQLEEWWDIGNQGPEGSAILAALKGHLLRISGGSIHLSSTQMQDTKRVPEDSFERIFGTKGPIPYKWMSQFLDAGASVGQITNKQGEGIGTCFIVDGGEFHDSLKGERLILTNDHVVSPHPEKYTSNPPLRVNKAHAKFELFSGTDGPREFPAKEIIWSSGSQDHDACLIRLETVMPDELEALPVVRYVPVANPGNEESIYIIGHPGGRTLSYSLQNNELLDHNCKLADGEVMPRYIHYFTPTEPGSSGSPALNAELDVIGLHHAGGKYMRKLDGSDETYPANEAIWIDSICRAAHADLEAGRVRYDGGE